MKILYIILFITISFSNITISQDLTAEQIYEKVNKTVVVILSYDDNNKLISQGSGVVYDDKGYVVTNYHVLGEGIRVEIRHYGDIIKDVKIIGIDINKDILILKVSENIFPAINIADISKLKIGQRIYAIGSPLGLENSISEGIIGGLRYFDDIGREFIQITASISPGSSGGAVVNSLGELIGISTLTYKEGQNLNFAIKFSDIQNIKIESLASSDIEINTLFLKGNTELDKGNYLDAINYYTEYINTKIKGKVYYTSDLSPVFNNRGVAYSLLKKYDKAIEDFNKAKSLDKKNFNAFYNLGLAFYYYYNYPVVYDACIEYFTEAIKLNPYYQQAYYNRGLMYAKKNKCYDAKKDFYKAIELDPSYENELKPIIESCK
jgi:tetratricopeptide (TPR) repeat protein